MVAPFGKGMTELAFAVLSGPDPAAPVHVSLVAFVADVWTSNQ